MRAGRIVARGTPGELKLRTGSRVRVEFWLREGDSLDASTLALLQYWGYVDMVRAGQYTLNVAREDLATVMELVINEIALERLDDFRIAPPSLEDVYLNLEEDDPIYSSL